MALTGCSLGALALVHFAAFALVLAQKSALASRCTEVYNLGRQKMHVARLANVQRRG